MQVAKTNGNQLSLWNEVLPQVDQRMSGHLVGTNGINDENELTSQTLRLLPINAGKDKTTGKAKDSLALRNPNATAAQLKAEHAKQSLELKDWLVQAAVKLNGEQNIGGLGIRATKSGRLSLVFKRLVPQVQLKTDEEYAAELGCTIEQVRAIRQKPAATIDAATGKELKPTPQNGTPELRPVKKGKGKEAAPEQPPVANPPAQQ